MTPRERIRRWDNGVPFQRHEAAAIMGRRTKLLDAWAGKSVGPDFYAPAGTPLLFYLLGDMRAWMPAEVNHRPRIRISPGAAMALWRLPYAKEFPSAKELPFGKELVGQFPFALSPRRNQIAHWPDDYLLRRTELALFLGVRPGLLEEWVPQNIGPPLVERDTRLGARYRLGDVRAWLLATRRHMVNRKPVRWPVL